jgi:hypothetical protein
MPARDVTAQELIDRVRSHFLPRPKSSAGLPTTAEQPFSDAVLLNEVPSPGGAPGRRAGRQPGPGAAAPGRGSRSTGSRSDDWPNSASPTMPIRWSLVDRVGTGVTTEELVRHTRRLVDQYEQNLAALNRAFAVPAGAAREQEDEVRT